MQLVNSKLTSFIITALVAIVTVGITPSAQAQTAALSNVTNTGFGRLTGYGGVVGFQFNLDSAVNLNALGLYVAPNGATLGQETTIGIWDSTGALLAEADFTIDPNAPLNDFVYSTNLSFTNGFNGTLSAGTTYEVGSLGFTVDGTVTSSYIGDIDNTFTAAPGLNVLNSVYNGGGFNAPLVINNANEAYIGPNFEFSAVPEPSTYVLMLAGLGALAMVMRARRIGV